MPCQTPHLDETTTAAPGISPGTVADEESLLREILNPDHIVNGEIMPSAIPVKELQMRGFSLHRLDHVTQKLVENSINLKLARTFQGQPRVSEGVACFTARVVREIRNNGNQAFVVIDTAIRCNPGHASIHLFNQGMKESLAKRTRKMLLPLLEGKMSVAEVFARQ